MAIVNYDGMTLGRIHPAISWGGVFLVSMQALRVQLMEPSVWFEMARRLRVDARTHERGARCARSEYASCDSTVISGPQNLEEHRGLRTHIT
jgi:hypothetical protein